jgi:hypothetical protein
VRKRAAVRDHGFLPLTTDHWPLATDLRFNTRLMEGQSCARCGKSDTEAWRLVKCPMCYKVVCEDCAVRHYGRYFCSNACATSFFMPIGDE